MFPRLKSILWPLNIILPYIAMPLSNLYSALKVDNFISQGVQIVKTKLAVTNCQYYFMKSLIGVDNAASSKCVNVTIPYPYLGN